MSKSQDVCINIFGVILIAGLLSTFFVPAITYRVYNPWWWASWFIEPTMIIVEFMTDTFANAFTTDHREIWNMVNHVSKHSI